MYKASNTITSIGNFFDCKDDIEVTLQQRDDGSDDDGST